MKKSEAQIQPTQETAKLQNEMISSHPISYRSCRLPTKCPPKPLANDIPGQELWEHRNCGNKVIRSVLHALQMALPYPHSFPNANPLLALPFFSTPLGMTRTTAFNDMLSYLAIASFSNPKASCNSRIFSHSNPDCSTGFTSTWKLELKLLTHYSFTL